MEKADFAKLLDSTLSKIRQDLLAAYPSLPGQSPEANLRSPRSPRDANREIPASRKGSGDVLDLPVVTNLSSHKSAMSGPEGERLDAEVVASTTSHRFRSMMGSGLKGMSEKDARATSQRLRVRLGAISVSKLVSGKTLHDAVVALGLTRYTVEEMNELVRTVADYIGLYFRTGFTGEEDDFGLGIPIWNWPDQESELQSRTSSDGKKIKKMRTVESHQSVVPAQALMELFLATDSIPKRIFGVKLFKQFQAIREILLAGETNRLVAELTFVRINDLAAPPEPMHPVVYLEPVVAVLIIANGVMIGFQTSPQFEMWEGWVYFEIFFTTCLFLEMGIRMWLLRCANYWCGTDRLWNLFDVFLAITGLTDVCIQAFAQQNSDIAGTSLLRFCRLIRLIRIVKVFRLKIMKDLRLMVKGLIAGIRTLVLAFSLLVAVLYVIAGLAAMTIGSSETELAGDFDTIPDAMFTAFRCFTGDCVNAEGYPLTSKLSTEFGLPFIAAYVACYMFITLGIFNVILAVYVDITMKAAKENEAVTAEQHSRESVRIAQTVRELLKKFTSAYRKFNKAESEHVGVQRSFDALNLNTVYADDDAAEEIEISKELFLLMVQDRGVQLLMDELELPPDRATLFEAIDADGSGTLHLGELVQGLLKIRGDLNKSDTVAALLATKALQHMLLKTQMRVHEVFLAVQSLKPDVQWMGTGTCTSIDSEQRHSEKTSTEVTGPPKSSLPQFPVPLLAGDAREPPLVEEDVNDVDGLLYFLPTDLHSQES